MPLYLHVIRADERKADVFLLGEAAGVEEALSLGVYIDSFLTGLF